MLVEKRAYQICSYCVMDTSDPDIEFDENNRCNHCRGAEQLLKERVFSGDKGEEKLKQLLDQIKTQSKLKEFDCIIGLSGGADSCYLAYLASKVWNLRVLAVHVNAGWNSEIAESNIEKLVKKCGITLHTYVVDWEEVRDLQLSYLKSGLANQDVPQDHVFFAVLFKLAAKEGIKHVFTGHNIASESILPAAWGYNAMDSKQLKSIHKRFGSIKLKSYKTISFFYRYVYLPFIYGLKIHMPLNLIDYDKEKAKAFLADEIGWKDYGVKHGESVFTRFFQNYWLPKRWGFDKRKAHASSQIVSGNMTREEALLELKKELYTPVEIQNDKDYICRKLNITHEELDNYFKMPLRYWTDFPSNEKLFRSAMNLQKKLKS